jgi:hypothetical protein
MKKTVGTMTQKKKTRMKMRIMKMMRKAVTNKKKMEEKSILCTSKKM